MLRLVGAPHPERAKRRAKDLVGLLVSQGALLRRRTRPAVAVTLDVAGTRMELGEAPRRFERLMINRD